MDITLAYGTATIGGLSMSLATARGAFDNLPIRVDRAYMATWGSVPNGVVNLFSGTVMDVEPGSTEVRLTAKSGMSKLNEYLPKRLFQPMCPFQVYDAECGVATGSFRDERTVAAGTTTSTLVMNSTSTNAVTGSRVAFTTGTLSGSSFTVTAVAGASLTVFPKMVPLPATGDAFYVFRGCDKDRGTCSSVFSNIARFGGFPDAPPEDFVLEKKPRERVEKETRDPRTGRIRNVP